MHDSEKSDGLIVPAKLPNETGLPAKEAMEGRSSAKGSTEEQNTPRTQSRTRVLNALDRVREAARKDRTKRFTALLHHVTVERLRAAYLALKRGAAAGVDGVTWNEYGQGLEVRLHDLHGRVHRGSYRAKPSRRVYIPKPDGRERPLGIASLEDKIVQRATVEVLNAIYESDFLGFSYGFRPGRNQHQALDALATAIMRKKVNFAIAICPWRFRGSGSKRWCADTSRTTPYPRTLDASTAFAPRYYERGVMPCGVAANARAFPGRD